MTEPEVEPTVAEPKTYDEGYIKELRSEAAGYRVERNELRKTVEDLASKVKGFEDGNKSEMEKQIERTAKAERALADKDREMGDMLTQSRIVSMASRMNIVDPEAAYKLVDLSSVDVEDPKSVEKALQGLVKRKPYLAKTPPTPGVGGPPVKGKKSADQEFAEKLRQAVRK